MIDPLYIIYGILCITVVVSVMAFSDVLLNQKLIFYPYQIRRDNSFYRFLTSGFIHGDYVHLGLNMFIFYMFSMEVMRFMLYETSLGIWGFLIIYIGGIIISSLPSYFKHSDNPGYRALGASGGVSSLLFACIILNPTQYYYLYFALPIPAFIFGFGYLIYSYYQGKNANDNIGHDAHFAGSIYGVVSIILIKPEIVQHFIQQILKFSLF